MRNLLLMTLLVFVVVVGVGLFFHPVIEEYGTTTVQYDEQTGAYFAEVTSRYEVEPTAGIKAGMPVSYYKTEGTVLRVSSKLETKEEILARTDKDYKSGLCIGGFIFWCIGALILWVDYRRQKRIDVKFSHVEKKNLN